MCSVTPGLSKTGLLREILSELNIGLPAGINRVQDLVKLLSNQIIDMHERGQRLVIIVDECHLLAADCLHIIRTISNIEIPERKLTTSLLFGESRLAQRLRAPPATNPCATASLPPRLTPAPPAPMRPASTSNSACSSLGVWPNSLPRKPSTALHTHSGGICRTLNKLCMLSLIKKANRPAASRRGPLP